MDKPDEDELTRNIVYVTSEHGRYASAEAFNCLWDNSTRCE